MRNRGFTLVELMVVLVIIAALLLFAVPMYQNQMLKGRRTDGMAALQDLAMRQEKFLLDRGTYTDDPGDVNASAASAEGWYTIAIEAPVEGECELTNCYRLTATPAAGSPQAGDAQCGTLSLSSRGEKSASGTLGDECW